MNDFQLGCMLSTKDLLKNKGIDANPFQEIIGKTERYFVAKVTIKNRNYEIYVYKDEMGLGVGKKWWSFEQSNFHSSQKLFEVFSKILSEQLDL